MRQYHSLEDFERAARRHLPRPVLAYLEGASETNSARDDSRAAFGRWRFLPRSLVGVRDRSAAKRLLDHQWAAPFGIAPMGLAALIAFRGDRVLAAAARRANVPFVLSATSLIRMEDVRAENPDAWFQAYVPGEPDRIDALIDRVAAAGFGTLVVTVDTVVSSNKENITRKGFSTPLKPGPRLLWDGAMRPRWSVGTFLRTLVTDGMPHFENSMATRGAPILSSSVMRDFGQRDHLDWSHLARIRDRWKGRLIVKGLLAPEDAMKARDIGAEGIVISNHGGRQLDYAIAPLDALPAVRAAVPGFPVMLDGGVRRGSDVLKALALGADFVFVGRPMLCAASVGGADGVDRALTLLHDEVHRNLGLLGLNRPEEINRSHLHHAIAPLPG